VPPSKNGLPEPPGEDHLFAVLHGRAPRTEGTGYEVRVAADLEVLARRIAQKGIAG